MAKRLVILNGTPRKNGNTSALTAAFAKVATQTGNQVTEFHLSGMRTGGCPGCWKGGKDPTSLLSERCYGANIPSVSGSRCGSLASPLYYWFISGFLKNAFDLLFAIAECDPNYRNPKKQSVLIMAAEGAGFEESEHLYDHLEKHIGWRSLGKILCGYVTQPGDIEDKKELKDAYESGKSIYPN